MFKFILRRTLRSRVEWHCKNIRTMLTENRDCEEKVITLRAGLRFEDGYKFILKKHSKIKSPQTHLTLLFQQSNISSEQKCLGNVCWINDRRARVMQWGVTYILLVSNGRMQQESIAGLVYKQLSRTIALLLLLREVSVGKLITQANETRGNGLQPSPPPWSFSSSNYLHWKLSPHIWDGDLFVISISYYFLIITKLH